MMKKIICGILILVSSMLVLASCGKFTCDACGEEKSGKKYEVEILGETGVVCEECNEELKEIQEGLGSLFE